MTKQRSLRWWGASLLVYGASLSLWAGCSQGPSGSGVTTPDGGDAPLASDASPFSDSAAPDAPSDTRPSSDSPPPDASACPPLGAAVTFDEEVAALCSLPDGNTGWRVSTGTKECGGLLAIGQWIGVDQQALYLFDPSSRRLVEIMQGTNEYFTCAGSATGVDLTRGSSPAPGIINSGTVYIGPDAAPCDFSSFQVQLGGGGWGFQPGCGADAAGSPGDASGQDASPE
jgi:hypothetical protein